MTYTLLHNPSCSKSRQGLALLEEKGVDLTVRKYMNAGEALSLKELKAIAAEMGVDSPRAFLRKGNAKDHGLALDASDADVYTAMAENPKLIERPIGLHNGKAALGRPPENLLEIL
ncbi:MAG: ArsC/Spx/MgsR family protein [Hyphomonas sp.]